MVGKTTTAHWRSGKLMASFLLSGVIIVIAYHARAEIVTAFAMLDEARLGFLAVALGVILASYFMSSQVFQVALRSMGYRMSALRLWAAAVVAIIASQAVPAGGVGSYAFLASMFHRRGVPAGESALIASLETLSYACAMVIFFLFSLAYLAFHGREPSVQTMGAAGLALVVIASVFFLLSRPAAVLQGWLNAPSAWVARLTRRASVRSLVRRTVDELVRARGLILAQPRTVALLIGVQLLALLGHSAALLLILAGLGAEVSLAITMAAFGVALITSTFNVLPGGGGTVEAALIAVLLRFDVGPAAVPAAVIFRLLNFWLIAPFAFAAYHWLSHERLLPRAQRSASGRLSID